MTLRAPLFTLSLLLLGLSPTSLWAQDPAVKKNAAKKDAAKKDAAKKPAQWWTHPEALKDGLFGLGEAPASNPMAARMARGKASMTARRNTKDRILEAQKAVVAAWAKAVKDPAEATRITNLYGLPRTIQNLGTVHATGPFVTVSMRTINKTCYVLVTAPVKEVLTQMQRGLEKMHAQLKAGGQADIPSDASMAVLKKVYAAEKARLEAAHTRIDKHYGFTPANSGNKGSGKKDAAGTAAPVGKALWWKDTEDVGRGLLAVGTGLGRKGPGMRMARMSSTTRARRNMQHRLAQSCKDLVSAWAKAVKDKDQAKRITTVYHDQNFLRAVLQKFRGPYVTVTYQMSPGRNGMQAFHALVSVDPEKALPHFEAAIRAHHKKFASGPGAAMLPNAAALAQLNAASTQEVARLKALYETLGKKYGWVKR